MKLLHSTQCSHRTGMMLVDCLIYLGVTALLVGLGVTLFLRCLDTANGLTRNADDIAGAVSLGERWRADLRLATAEPARSPDATELTIPQGDTLIAYRLANGVIWRQEHHGAWTRLLDRVVNVEWNAEVRPHATAWHMDLELKTKKPHTKLRPLFSFIGVAGSREEP